MENVLAFAQEQWILVGLLVAFLFLLFRYESAKGGTKFSVQELTLAVNSGNAVLIDVRETKEFGEGHIVDALNIPHKKIADSLKLLEKYRQKQLIVIDKLGQHSGAVVKTLSEQGYQVVRLGGGIGEWQQQNLPLVK